MDEIILYQDDERTSPRILVSSGRLKVGDSSYSLDGASGVSLMDSVKYHRQETRLWRRLVWFVMFGAVLFSPFLGYISFLFPLAAGVMAIREYLRDERNKWDQHNRYHDAELTLTKAGFPTKILIGSFPTRAPLDKWELLGGVRNEPLPEETMAFFKNVERVKTIAEAVGRAIGNNALATESDANQPRLSETPVRVVTVDPPFASDAEVSLTNAQTEETLKSATIAVDDGSFRINGVVIPIPASTNLLDHLLSPHRCRKPNQFFWDDWGIKAWGDDQNSLTSFTIYLRENEYWGREHYPKKTYVGELTVGGVLVTVGTKIADIVAQKHGLALTKEFSGWVNVPHSLLRDFFGLQWRMTISLDTAQEGTVSSILFTQPGGFKTRVSGWLKKIIYG